MSETPVTPHSVRYRERLWVPWWWWPLGFGLAALISVEVNMGVPSLPNWLPFAVLFVVAAGALLWLGRHEVRVTSEAGGVELWAGEAHLPSSVIARCAEIPRSASPPHWDANSIRPPTYCTAGGLVRWCWWCWTTRTTRLRTGW